MKEREIENTAKGKVIFNHIYTDPILLTSVGVFACISAGSTSALSPTGRLLWEATVLKGSLLRVLHDCLYGGKKWDQTYQNRQCKRGGLVKLAPSIQRAGRPHFSQALWLDKGDSDTQLCSHQKEVAAAALWHPNLTSWKLFVPSTALLLSFQVQSLPKSLPALLDSDLASALSH